LFQASAYALFAACCAIGLSGFDMFQTWLLGAAALAWSLMLLARRLTYASAAAGLQSLKAMPGVSPPDR
jgi:hypothetical protein